MSFSVPDDGVDPRIEQTYEAIAKARGDDPEEVVTELRNREASYGSMAKLYYLESTLWRVYKSAQPELGGRTPHAQLVAWSWITQTFRQAHTVFGLVSNGFPDCAFANARCAMEHGIYLSLMAGIEDVDFVLDRLEHRYIQTGQKLSAAAPKDQVPEFLGALLEDVGDLCATPNPESDWVRWMGKICERLENGDAIYSYYLGVSAYMHAGFGSASGSMCAAMGEELMEPVPSHEPAVYDKKLELWLSLGACGWAGWSADRLFGTEHFTPACNLLKPLGFVPLVVNLP